MDKPFEKTMARYIAAKESKDLIARSYAFGLRWGENVNWLKVNFAIGRKYGRRGLLYIRERAYRILDEIEKGEPSENS